MAKHVYVILTNSVDGKDDEYNDWYTNQHLDDVLRCVGFTSAQRFRLDETTPAQTSAHRYLAIYEIETDDIGAVNAALIAAAGTPALPLSPAMDLRTMNAWYFQAITDRRTV